MEAILLALALSFCASTPSGNYVYICTGPKATVYHKTSDCRGLNRCSGSIKKVSEAQAKSMKRRRCQICY